MERDDDPGPLARGAVIIRLSDEIGRRVLTRDGCRVGRVADLSLRLGPAHPRVTRLVVRRRRGSALLVPWDRVDRVDRTHLELRDGSDVAAAAVDPRRLPLDTDELLLARDVLDTQVVDLHGRHLSRVADVLLEPDGDSLTVVAVDVGMAGLLRRLGLGPLVAGAGVRAVDWHDLHLTSPRGHGVQLGVDASAFHRLDSQGLAELLARLSTSRATDVVRAVEPARAAAAIHRSHPHTGRRIVSALSSDERSDLIAGAAEDHARTIARFGEQTSPLHERRFLRTRGWRLRRPPAV